MLRVGWRIIRQVGLRPLWKLFWNMGVHGGRALSRFEERAAKGEYFPAFLFISVTDQCNLTCQGCWVTPCKPPRSIPIPVLRDLISACRSHGVRFFGILGGEPLLYKGLDDIFSEFSDCYFQVFTNGLLLDETVARTFRKAGNVTPLISIEGDELVSDVRRGGKNVMHRSIDAVKHCCSAGLLTGIATSVCQSNIDTLATRDFVAKAADLGAHYLWYYIYRPVGPRPCPELGLTDEQIISLRRFIVDVRTDAPLIVVDSYWDAQGRAMCPAVLGLAPHIGPGGDVEPCPPIQFADRNVKDGSPVDALTSSEFIAAFRKQISELTRGCVLMEDPGALGRLVDVKGARDSSGRGTARDELSAMSVCPSHHQPGNEIPERNGFYKFAKRRWFFGFGAYG